MNRIYILSGANLGRPLVQLAQASTLLTERLGQLVVASSIYESEGWGVKDQPLFYNQALIIDTPKDKQQCLEICQQIESELGRVRMVRWDARVIDIDILYFNNEVYKSDQLIIPHPLLQERNFALIPLVEIAGEYIHPQLFKNNLQLLAECEDKLSVKKVNTDYEL